MISHPASDPLQDASTPRTFKRQETARRRRLGRRCFISGAMPVGLVAARRLMRAERPQG